MKGSCSLRAALQPSRGPGPGRRVRDTWRCCESSVVEPARHMLRMPTLTIRWNDREAGEVLEADLHVIAHARRSAFTQPPAQCTGCSLSRPLTPSFAPRRSAVPRNRSRCRAAAVLARAALATDPFELVLLQLLDRVLRRSGVAARVGHRSIEERFEQILALVVVTPDVGLKSADSITEPQRQHPERESGVGAQPLVETVPEEDRQELGQRALLEVKSPSM